MRLLLVKPAGQRAGAPLARSETRTTLLEVPEILWASLGRGSRFTPHVESETLSAAKTLLEKRSLRVGRVVILPDIVKRARRRTLGASVSIRSVESGSARRGTVVKQAPRAGTRIEKGTHVVLHVSRGG